MKITKALAETPGLFRFWRERLCEWLATMRHEKWFAAYGHAPLSHPHGYAQIATKARATG